MTLRPRLLLVTDSSEPSGVGAHMLTLARRLADDHEVIVGGRAHTGLLRRAAAAGHAVKALIENEELELGRWIERAAPDIVHVHAGIGWEGHALAHAARATGAAVIRTEHLPYLLTDPGQRADHARGIEQVDRLVAVSDSVAGSYLEAGVAAPLLATVENGIEPLRQPAHPRAALRAEWSLGDAPVLLMVGRFTPQKGHALALDALPAIRAALPTATLLLVGEGPLLLPIAREVAKRGLAGSVRMLGARDDVAELMAAADLLLLPSSFEGLPLVALEAMAAGLPIVASDVPGNADAIEHGRSGWLVPANDPTALTATVVDALADRDRLAEVARTAADRQRTRFSAERMASGIRAVYGAVRPEQREASRRMSRTRVGFVGCGGIAHRHFGVLEQFDDVEVAAVADVDFARATEAAGRFGARAFDDAEAMLAAVPLDALYICVPPFAHGAPERLALARNLPFFVEKPVGLDLALAEAIEAEVADAGLVTAVGYHWRYLDTVDEAKALLAANPARLMSGYWLDSTPPPRWWWRQDQSGGQMVEQTSHLLDLARWLAGDVVQAFGLASHTPRAAFPDLDIATVSTASLRFASGALANFASTCLLDWNHRVGLHIFGERLAIELTDHDLMVDVGRGRPVRGAHGDPVWREDRDFIDAVQGRENRIRCPYSEAVATLRLAFAVSESARTGQPVELDTRREPTAAAREPAHV